MRWSTHPSRKPKRAFLAGLAFSVGGTALAIAEPAWTKRQSEPLGINASTKSNNAAAACPLNPQALLRTARPCNYQSPHQSPAGRRNQQDRADPFTLTARPMDPSAQNHSPIGAFLVDWLMLKKAS